MMIAFLLAMAAQAGSVMPSEEPTHLPGDIPRNVTPRDQNAPQFSLDIEDYPAEALRNHWEGVSEIAILVDEQGRGIACEVVHSSGHDVLDRATCSIAIRKIRFKPATDKDGYPIKSIFDPLRIAWRLPA